MKVKGNIGRKCLIGKAGALLLTRRSGTLRRAGGRVYYTNDGSLGKLNATMDLAMPKTPGYRIEILTSDPNFNLSNIEVIRTVTGNVNGHGGGGWEILYRGTYLRDALYQWTITPLP